MMTANVHQIRQADDRALDQFELPHASLGTLAAIPVGVRA